LPVKAATVAEAKVSRCAGLMAFAQQGQQDGAWANKTTYAAIWRLLYGLDRACKETKRSDMVWLTLLATP
jgi:hypothetical protein